MCAYVCRRVRVPSAHTTAQSRATENWEIRSTSNLWEVWGISCTYVSYWWYSWNYMLNSTPERVNTPLAFAAIVFAALGPPVSSKCCRSRDRCLLASTEGYCAKPVRDRGEGHQSGVRHGEGEGAKHLKTTPFCGRVIDSRRVVSTPVPSPIFPRGPLLPTVG